MIETIAPKAALWIAGVVAIVAAIHLPRSLDRWLAVRHSYGEIPWSLAFQLYEYAKRSPMARPVWLTASLVPVTTVIIFRQFIHDDPYKFTLFCVTLQAYGLIRAAEVVLPPTALLLSTSSSASASTLAQLTSDLPKYRVVTFLRPTERLEWPILQKFFYNNFRTRNDYEWRSFVFHLMDVVPVIVVDAQADTPGLAEETKRIVEKGYLPRTIFVAQQASVHEQSIGLLSTPVDCSLLSQKIAELINRHPNVEERRRKQVEYSEMLRAVPRQHRFPKSLIEMVVNARVIEQYEKEKFFQRCKRMKPEEAARHLIEKIPSIIGDKEELRYLRGRRGLEEVEILLISALESVKWHTNANSMFNICNSYNSLGELARFQREWEKAITLLEQAIQCFDELVLDPNQRASAVQELGTAHFNIGEVYMARFLESKEHADRNRAFFHLKQSISYDREMGADTSIARERIQELEFME